MRLKSLSRRDFLKLGGLGLAGLFLSPPRLNFENPFTAQQGRVTTRSVWMYDRPSAKAKPVRLCPRDTLLPISGTAVSDEDDSHNRVWYEASSEGFVHSGNIQPVRTQLNTPRMDIPKTGLLAEVSVPFTDAFESADKTSTVIYRLYYETTHWVKSVQGAGDTVWYQVRDDKYDKDYFVRADHMRILSEEELSAITPEVEAKDKRIVVRLKEQVTIAYEYDQPVFVAPVSTGVPVRNGVYTTPQGIFKTYYKRPSRHMAAGDIAASGFDLPGVSWVQYLTRGGISFHGTYWHNDFGAPRSHGCINLSAQSAKWLYRWTSPMVPLSKELIYGYKGTHVEIIL